MTIETFLFVALTKLIVESFWEILLLIRSIDFWLEKNRFTFQSFDNPVSRLYCTLQGRRGKSFVQVSYMELLLTIKIF